MLVLGFARKSHAKRPVSNTHIYSFVFQFHSVDPTTVVLRAGSTFRKNGTIIPIASVIPHPEYDNPKFDKDVAVMKTVEPLEFSETIQPIPLPWKNRFMTGGTEIIVSGWGRQQVRLNVNT